MREEFLAQLMLSQQVLADLVSAQAMVNVKEDSDILEYTLLSLIGIEPIIDKKYTVGPVTSSSGLCVQVSLPAIPRHYEAFLTKMKESS